MRESCCVEGSQGLAGGWEWARGVGAGGRRGVEAVVFSLEPRGWGRGGGQARDGRQIAGEEKEDEAGDDWQWSPEEIQSVWAVKKQ